MTEPLSLFGAGEAARAYESSLVSHVFLPFARRLVDTAAPTRHEDILDLACGTGAVTRIVAERCGPAKVRGIDIADVMLDVARSLAPGVTFLHGSFDSLPVPDRRTDLVLCQQGLQFTSDRTAAVQEMARVLRRGGRVVVSCWVDVTRNPVFNAFCQGLVALGWDDLAAAFAVPFSLGPDELRSLFSTPAYEQVQVHELMLELPVGDLRELARVYASGPFASRYAAASESEQQRYLDVVTASASSTEPFRTSVLTAIRANA